VRETVHAPSVAGPPIAGSPEAPADDPVVGSKIDGSGAGPACPPANTRAMPRPTSCSWSGDAIRFPPPRPAGNRTISGTWIISS